MRIFLTLAIMASFITTVLAVAPPIKVDIIGTAPGAVDYAPLLQLHCGMQPESSDLDSGG